MIEPVVFGDNRGVVMESFNARKLHKIGVETDFKQDNFSFSTNAGTVRGLHYQKQPKAQTKLIQVVAGAIYDVAVDIRKNSSTFGQWASAILTADNKRQLLIPKGFAHGFCTLVPGTAVLYKMDEYYAPEEERGILWDDPLLAIDWPVSEPILSERDKGHPRFADADID